MPPCPWLHHDSKFVRISSRTLLPQTFNKTVSLHVCVGRRTSLWDVSCNRAINRKPLWALVHNELCCSMRAGRSARRCHALRNVRPLSEWSATADLSTRRVIRGQLANQLKPFAGSDRMLRCVVSALAGKFGQTVEILAEMGRKGASSIRRERSPANKATASHVSAATPSTRRNSLPSF